MPDRTEHRAMILDPYKWPHMYLPLKKKRADGLFPDCGLLTTATTDETAKLIVQKNQTIFGLAVGEVEPLEYANVDALLDDGWLVD